MDVLRWRVWHSSSSCLTGSMGWMSLSFPLGKHHYFFSDLEGWFSMPKLRFESVAIWQHQQRAEVLGEAGRAELTWHSDPPLWLLLLHTMTWEQWNSNPKLGLFGLLAIFHNLAGCDASERNFTGEPENGALGMYYPEPYGLFKKKSKGEKFGSFFTHVYRNLGCGAPGTAGHLMLIAKLQIALVANGVCVASSVILPGFGWGTKF